MDFYKILTNETSTNREKLINNYMIQNAVEGEISLEEYVCFLIQAYHHVKYTCPLLMAVGSKLSSEQEWLRVAVAEYIEEEIGHEEWILDDIQACNYNKELVRFSKPNQSTEMMLAYAWYVIHRVNPIGFFGMVLVLEGTSITMATKAADAIQSGLNLPDNAFSYLRSHGELDLEHMKFFEGLMNKITDKNDQEIIIHSANNFYDLYGSIFTSIRDISTTISELKNQLI
ncbi:MAG: iron-containing redox enzyme family protein [Candidatus Marinimicrobia bacterium]|jgi:thiaminase|nr:iron-containing redox enzyme family protein [Candidatus Neomarinimicrobiota bacterium]MBT7580983.1 iron-containing redox enzyme family protein [Candidatus Neomarinimicrobiota bacterium]|tara:strand:+ start:270 stop:956 length:687 start_codon:yes stop_codon:yes gene_type:complete